MKINNRTLNGPEIKVLVIPRTEGDLVIQAQAVLDYRPFEAICPRPVPPLIMMRGEIVGRPNMDDPKFMEALMVWSSNKTNWMVLQSLSVTEGLEWDNIKMDDPTTWNKVNEELSSAGFTNYEINLIINLVISANGMNQESIDEATKSFLATRALARKA